MRPQDFQDLARARVLLLDGGYGSLLISMGLELGRAPEWWLLEHPDRIREAHALYATAGSDIIQANSFGGSPARLAAAGLDGALRQESTP